MDQSITDRSADTQDKPLMAFYPSTKALDIPMTIAKHSTNVHSFGYHPETQTLHIKFLSGSVYQYEGVPVEVASALHSHKSIGAYVSMNIKGKYPTKMLEAKPERKPVSDVLPEAQRAVVPNRAAQGWVDTPTGAPT